MESGYYEGSVSRAPIFQIILLWRKDLHYQGNDIVEPTTIDHSWQMKYQYDAKMGAMYCNISEVFQQLQFGNGVYNC